MAVTTSEKQTVSTRTARGDKTAQEIIATARTTTRLQTRGGSVRAACGMSLLSGFLFWASFPPLNWSPLAWIAPVPLLLLVRLRVPPHRLELATYVGGGLFYASAFQWMRLGDPTMYLAWAALAAYLAFTFPIFIAVCRVAVHRWRLPLAISAPVAWVGLEYAKAHLFTGVAWYFLGHTQYRWLEIIQLSDVFGAYGVSFLMMTTAAAIAELIPFAWFRQCHLLAKPVALAAPHPVPDQEGVVTPVRRWPVVVSTVLVLSALTYGYVRRDQADFQPGPRVALIQGNFIASLRIPPEDFGKQYLTHLRLTAETVRERPDLIVWPESMFRWPLAQAPANLTDDELQQLAPKAPPRFWRDSSVRETLEGEARKTGAAIIFGLECVDLQSDGQIRHTNSAVLARPDMGLSNRYDKIHLVPFGEYLPFQKAFPWLQRLTPYPPDFGLTAGSGAAVFEYGPWRMVPVICFEDTVPHLVRNLMRSSNADNPKHPTDLLVNLSNDGWFHGSSGLDQHLITATFRAVECRTPLVRAVNTGISAFIDGDGAIRTPDVFIDGDKQGRTTPQDPKTGRWHKQLNAAQVMTVPLDSRDSLYVRWGDWFAMTCLAGLLLLCLSPLIPSTRFPASTESTAGK